MLRISKNLYVHILTVVLFSVCFFTGRLKEIVIVYSVMTLHEAAHMAAAYYRLKGIIYGFFSVRC